MSSESELKKRVEELEKEVEAQKQAVDDCKKANDAIVACLKKENEQLVQTVCALDVDVKKLREENIALQDQIQELQDRLDKAHHALNAFKQQQQQKQSCSESEAKVTTVDPVNQSFGPMTPSMWRRENQRDLHTLWNTPVFSLVDDDSKARKGKIDEDDDIEVKTLLESPDIKQNCDLRAAFDLITHRNKPTDKLVNLLGADMDRCLGPREMTPLMYACYFGNLFAYEALVRAGARCGLRGAGENTLLHYAVLSGESMLAFSIAMMHSKMHEARNSDGETPLHIAVRTGRHDVLRFLAKDKYDVHKITTANDGATPLHYAAALADLESTKLLLDRFSGILDVNKNSALHSAVTLPPEEMNVSPNVLEERAKVVELLLTSGKFDVNAKNKDGNTPLHLACMLDYPPLVKLLCDSNADVSAVNTHGLQPLHVAAAFNTPGCCEELLSRGAKVDGDSVEMTPAYCAASEGHSDLLQMLHSKHNADILRPCGDGWAPLHAACCRGHDHAVKYLLEHGENVNRSFDSQTPLMMAVRHDKPDVVKALISAGADIATVRDLPMTESMKTSISKL